MILASLFSALALLAPAKPVTLLAAGDVASCRLSGDEATARLLDRAPGTIALILFQTTTCSPVVSK